MTPTNFTDLSKHATIRCRNRGIPDRILSLVLAHADKLSPVGGGATSERISKSMAAALIADGHVPDDIGRATRLAVVVNADGRVITVIRPKSGGRGRRYRRTH